MENFVSFAWAELSAHGRSVSLGDKHVHTKDNMGEHSWGRRVAKMDGKVSPTLFILMFPKIPLSNCSASSSAYQGLLHCRLKTCYEPNLQVHTENIFLSSLHCLLNINAPLTFYHHQNSPAISWPQPSVSGLFLLWQFLCACLFNTSLCPFLCGQVKCPPVPLHSHSIPLLFHN